MARHGKLRQLCTVGIAIWLIAISASVNLLHRHVALGCGEMGRIGPPGVEHNTASNCLTPCLFYASGLEKRMSPVSDLCPVCLFMAKHRAGRLGAPVEPTPEDDGAGIAECGQPIPAKSLDIPSAAPRAPPC